MLALALMPFLLLGGFVAAGIAQLTLLRQQLATAADLSAIAAAKAAGDPCTQAALIADAHQVELTECTALGADWRIEVRAPIDAVAIRLLTFIGRGPDELREVAVAGYE